MNQLDKKLVEQAWYLQTNLKRCIDSSCNRCIKDVLVICNNPADKKQRTIETHVKAYERSVRRLHKLWS